jgi:hypothetical protein
VVHFEVAPDEELATHFGGVGKSVLLVGGLDAVWWYLVYLVSLQWLDMSCALRVGKQRPETKQKVMEGQVDVGLSSF